MEVTHTLPYAQYCPARADLPNRHLEPKQQRMTKRDLRRTRDLLGKRAESPDVAALLQRARLPYALSPDAERGTVAVTSPDGATHTAEELVVRCPGSQPPNLVAFCCMPSLRKAWCSAPCGGHQATRAPAAHQHNDSYKQTELRH